MQQREGEWRGQTLARGRGGLGVAARQAQESAGKSTPTVVGDGLKVTITSLLINIHDIFYGYFLHAARCYRDVVGRIHDSVLRINQQA